MYYPGFDRRKKVLILVMASKNFKYSNGEVTIVWQPELCIHSGRCVRGLPDVFKPKEKPWITPEESTTEKIVTQVKRCPSGALSFFMNGDASEKTKQNL